MNLEIIGSPFSLNTANEITKLECNSNLFLHFKEIMFRYYKKHLTYFYEYDYLKLLDLDLVIISDASNLHFGITPIHPRAYVFDVMCDWLNKPLIFITHNVSNSKNFSRENKKIVQNIEELDNALQHFNIKKNSNILLIDADFLNPFTTYTSKVVNYLKEKANTKGNYEN